MKIRKKIRHILIFCLLAVVIIYTLIWAGVNFVIVPKFIIPTVREYITSNLRGELNLVIEDISFHPFRGFLLHDVKLYGSVPSRDNYILRAELVDINLAFLPLLWKQVEIEEFGMFDVDLNIERNSHAVWNLRPLLELSHLIQTSADQKSKPGFRLVIKKFTIKNGWIDYADYYKEGNVLARRFADVNLKLKTANNRLFNLSLCAGSKDRKEESIELNLDYDKSQEVAKGQIRLNTKYLGRYWTYYLDDWLKPWHLDAQNINAELWFSYSAGRLILDGQYTIDKGSLRYGDLNIKGNAQVKHKQRYVKSDPFQDTSEIQMSLEDVSSLSGKYVFLDKGSCSLVITKREFTIKNLTGTVSKQPINLSGKFTYQEPKELTFKGTLSNLDTDFSLKLLPSNQGTLDWHSSIKNSYIKMHADISDLKNHIFNLRLDSNVQLEDLTQLLKANEAKVKGLVNITGNVQGELDKANSLQGSLGVEVDNFSALDLEAISFTSQMGVKAGLLRLEIPKTKFYKGNLYGTIQLDFDKWGCHLRIDNLDIEEFVKPYPEFKGTTGIFSGNIVCVSRWSDFKTILGGGYFHLIKCDLRKASLFAETERGIASVIQGFIMPDMFKNAEGNFEIKKETIFIKNAYSESNTLNLSIKGEYDFSGVTDFTIGASILGGGVLKTARQIMFPMTIGFDALANSIRVNISGKWPNLKSKAAIEPMSWLNELFGLLNRCDPNKYTLKDLWSKP